MPGPVSDSYDPEFGTADNASKVRGAILGQRKRIDDALGPQLLSILDIIEGNFEKDPRKPTLRLNEQQMRVIRFALNRALETL